MGRRSRLATRGSPLALGRPGGWSSCCGGRAVAAIVVVVVETAGDRRTDVPLDRLGGQGVFVKEVQSAVLAGEADAAVHSAKDLPSAPELAAPGLVLAAFPERADPRDAWWGPPRRRWAPGRRSPPARPVGGPSSANLRPDLTFAGLRGNLATRLARGRHRLGGCGRGGEGRRGPAGLVAAGGPGDRGARARRSCCPRSARGPWPWSAGPTTSAPAPRWPRSTTRSRRAAGDRRARLPGRAGRRLHPAGGRLRPVGRPPTGPRTRVTAPEPGSS